MIHFGTHPSRTDKFYTMLPKIIKTLQRVATPLYR